MSVTIVHRKPTAEEFESLVKSVGFRGHDYSAVEVALSNTLFCVCAEEGQRTVGVGRVIGDGAISLLLTNVMVRPTHQRKGIGSLIVTALCSAVERLPYKNIVALRGSEWVKRGGGGGGEPLWQRAETLRRGRRNRA